MSTQKTGKLGEQTAKKFLIQKGYKIIKTNLHLRFAELDIIAIDPQFTLVFIEVKTRKTNTFGPINTSLTYTKIQRLKKAAIKFLSQNHINIPLIWRIDLIGIELNRNNSPKKITHIKNILDG
ncbi:MAG: YraN family protein [Candidatus Peregrinibacteria bacterium]